MTDDTHDVLAASGEIMLGADTAMRLAENGEVVILMRIRTSLKDTHLLHVTKGVLAAYNSLISHTALVARGQVPITKLASAEVRL